MPVARKSKRSKFAKVLVTLLALTNILWATLFVSMVTWTLLKSQQTEEQSLQQQPQQDDENIPICTDRACLEQSLLLMKASDASTSPCDDFYQFVCGSWIENTQLAIGEDYTSPINALEKDIQKVLSQSVFSWKFNVTDQSSSGAIDKAVSFFHQCTASGGSGDKRRQQSIFDLVEVLQDHGGAPLFTPDWSEESFDLTEFMVTSIAIGRSFLVLHVSEDLSNSSIFRLALSHPEYFYERQLLYYVQNYPDYRKFLMSTVTEFGQVLKLNPKIPLEKSVNGILEFEQLLFDQMVANSSDSADDSSPPSTIKFSELSEFYQTLVVKLMQRFLDGQIVDPDEEIILSADEISLQKLEELVKKTPKGVLANFEAWSLLRGPLFEALPDNLRNLQVQIMQQLSDRYGGERQEQCLSLTKKYYEYAIGRLYIEKHYNVSHRDKVQKMAEIIAEAFRSISLIENDWLDAMTREEALAKMERLRFEVAFPDFIMNSSALDSYYRFMPEPTNTSSNTSVFARTLIDTVLAEVRTRFDKFARRVVDHAAWEMGPYEVNAYYSLSANKIAVPAGHLNLPLYHPDLPYSFNFGGLGWTLGHEIAHAFDTKGRRFDRYGNLNDWWSEESLAIFNNKTACIRDAAASHCYTDLGTETRCINAKSTLDEDVADLVGLRAAYYGFMRWKAQNPKKDAKLAGLMQLSDEQLFFIASGVGWCEKHTKSSLEMSLLTDNHSPVYFRLNNVVRNMPEFAKAFGCPAGSKMNLADEGCRVW